MKSRSPIKHCRNCGIAVIYRVPDDTDERERAVCPSCQTIHYENPLPVVGTVPYWHDRVLLCRRNIEPRWGKWTLPAGFMELGETAAEGAARETHEEAGAQFELGGLAAVISVPHAGQVHLFYWARLQSESFAPGIETLEARLFSAADVPWEEIAFRSVGEMLRRFFDDQRQGRLQTHHLDIH